MKQNLPETGSWQTHSSQTGYSTSHVGGPAQAEANQPKEAKGNSKAHEKALRESGHKDIRAHVGKPLHHDASDAVPIKVPSKEHPKDREHRNERDPAAKHHAEYATEKAARDWSGNGSKA